MNGPLSNAFSSSSNGFASYPRRALTSMLVAMQARQETTSSGFALRLTPLRFADAMSKWAEIQEHRNSLTLLIEKDTLQPRGNAPSLVDFTRNHNIAVKEEFSESMILLNDEDLQRFLDADLDLNLCAVRLEGPVEFADARAIEKAIKYGRSPLEVELRASAFLEMERTRCLHFEARDIDDCSLLICEAFRHYIAAIRNQPVSGISPPERWQITRLMEIEGAISIRPIETEVYSTSIDVGVCVKAGEKLGPANCSLIFDVFSNTWHDES